MHRPTAGDVVTLSDVTIFRLTLLRHVTAARSHSYCTSYDERHMKVNKSLDYLTGPVDVAATDVGDDLFAGGRQLLRIYCLAAEAVHDLLQMRDVA
jgi:hypothetical protein